MESLSIDAQMLIRKPVAEVYEAFVDPAVTSKFWFTKSSGPLEQGAELEWAWEMYGVSARLKVLELEPKQRILIEWDNPACPVEWQFTDRGDGTTLVKIRNWGFHGSEAEQIAQAIDAKGGFALVLANAKAWLEHGLDLQLIRDHFPPDIV